MQATPEERSDKTLLKPIPGFFFCCPKFKTQCELGVYMWPAIPKHMVISYQQQSMIQIVVDSSLCDGKEVPLWMGYAFTKNPFGKKFGAPIYAQDKYRLPASLWRCQLVTASKNAIKSCEWKSDET